MFVATSGRRGGGQGLFARRQFLPGELVSYFGGKKTLEEQFLFENMTLEEEEDAASYYFNLADNVPRWWAVPEGQVIWFQACHTLWWYVHLVNSVSPELFLKQVIDIPPPMRSTSKYRTTLGHKTNSAFFEERNAVFDTVSIVTSEEKHD